LDADCLLRRSYGADCIRRRSFRAGGYFKLMQCQGVACNALHEAPACLARWILMTQDRTSNRTLALTQDVMAVMTGVQRTPISGIATRFKAEGLIGFSRGRVEVRDREGLQKRACECYRAIRDRFSGLERKRVEQPLQGKTGDRQDQTPRGRG
jgi:hypothetical protein